MQPDLSGALFVFSKKIKKRERRAEIAAIKNSKKLKKIRLRQLSTIEKTIKCSSMQSNVCPNKKIKFFDAENDKN